MDEFYASFSYETRANLLSEKDGRKKELLEKRFNKDQKNVDEFVRAWLFLSSVAKEKHSVFFEKKRAEEMASYAKTLCLNEEVDSYLEAEWKNFAQTWMTFCKKDRQYRSTAFGMIERKEEAVRCMILEEIERNGKALAPFSNENSLSVFIRCMKEAVN